MKQQQPDNGVDRSEGLRGTEQMEEWRALPQRLNLCPALDELCNELEVLRVYKEEDRAPCRELRRSNGQAGIFAYTCTGPTSCRNFKCIARWSPCSRGCRAATSSTSF